MILILSILLINISLAELIQPENEKNINYTHVLFEWTQEENAYSYNIQIDISETFNLIFISDIPQLTNDKTDQCRRFISLIDMLYAQNSSV